MLAKISVANSFLRSLESKGILRPIGGYSGHRILHELGPTQPPNRFELSDLFIADVIRAD